MATSQLNEASYQLRRAVLMRDGAGLSDEQLLECFITRRDEAAFESLVRRHGPMVLGVASRVAGNAADAEDAFQATFLVLVRKAASLQTPGLLGNFLYGVAYRTALKAKAAAARRRRKERQVEAMPQPVVEPEADWQEIRPVLDRELNRLPDKYRVPVILCDLEGRTRREAAEQLALPEGTLSGRLTTARRLLAKRLTRHGLTLSGGAVAVVLSRNAASAAVPGPLVLATVSAATQVAIGQTGAGGVISTEVAALTEGVMKTMLLTRFYFAVGALVMAIVVAGGGWLTHQALAEKPARKADPGERIAPQKAKEAGPRTTTEVSGIIRAAGPNTITIASASKERFGARTFPVVANARVFLDDGTGDRLGFTEGKLTDLSEGASVTLRLSSDPEEVVAIWAEGPTIQGTLKALDPGNNRLTVLSQATKVEPGGEKTFTVGPNTRIAISTGFDKKGFDRKGGIQTRQDR